jgi:hypothetical protein
VLSKGKQLVVRNGEEATTMHFGGNVEQHHQEHAVGILQQHDETVSTEYIKMLDLFSKLTSGTRNENRSLSYISDSYCDEFERLSSGMLCRVVWYKSP